MVERISLVFSFIVEKTVLFPSVQIIIRELTLEKIDAAQTTHNSVLCEKVKIILSEFKSLKNYQIHHE